MCFLPLSLQKTILLNFLKNMDKEKINSKELGKNLFNFALLSKNKFLESFEKQNTLNMEVKVKEEEINQEELLIAYLWLVFHFLNMAGQNKYEKTTHFLHSTYADYLNLSESVTEEAMNHLLKRYNEYKKDFQQDNSIGNFQRIGVSISTNILGKPTIDFVFHTNLGLRSQQLFITLGELLKEFELID